MLTRFLNGDTTDMSVFAMCVTWCGFDANATCAVGGGFMHCKKMLNQTHGARVYRYGDCMPDNAL